LTRTLFGATFAKIAREARCAALAVPENAGASRRHTPLPASRAA
jgi:hypothetical protein